jgi:hypothetical protein
MIIRMDKIKITMKNLMNLKLMINVKIKMMKNSRKKIILRIMNYFQTKMHMIN